MFKSSCLKVEQIFRVGGYTQLISVNKTNRNIIPVAQSAGTTSLDGDAAANMEISYGNVESNGGDRWRSNMLAVETIKSRMRE